MLSAVLHTTVHYEDRITALENSLLNQIAATNLKCDISQNYQNEPLDQMDSNENIIFMQWQLAITCSWVLVMIPMGLVFLRLLKPKSTNKLGDAYLPSNSTVDYAVCLDLICNCYLSDYGSSDNLLSLPVAIEPNSGFQRQTEMGGDAWRNIVSSSLEIEEVDSGKSLRKNSITFLFGNIASPSSKSPAQEGNVTINEPITDTSHVIPSVTCDTWSSENTAISGELEYKIDKLLGDGNLAKSLSSTITKVQQTAVQEGSHLNIERRINTDSFVCPPTSFHRDRFKSRTHEIEEVLVELTTNPSYNHMKQVVSVYMKNAMDDSLMQEVRLSSIDLLRYFCLHESPLEEDNMYLLSRVMEEVFDPKIACILLLLTSDDPIPVNLFLLLTDFFAYSTFFPSMFQLKMILEKYSTYLNKDDLCTLNAEDLLTAIDVESFIAFCNEFPEHLNRFTSKLHIHHLCHNKYAYWEQPSRAKKYMSFFKSVIMVLECERI
ncbi:uncharacterized protein KQ657_001896 [Scheffersomyces spartinae]|uniref:Uncharacterized protein n=1 Tax=Scheffersomyces spartinae TaxID=45513 RepID=A0A9P7V6P9_9ASCO|nr:uncharacterized protein KQ657_001896 [Scheffersomyces spartinae]KAG7192182.1 hypothetical protein KQ657_001896 [Scheffersomyces spartinae]